MIENFPEGSLKYGVIRIGYIRSTDISSGMVTFVDEENYHSEYPDDNIEFAKIACKHPTDIKINSQCIIVKTNPYSSKYYCIGFVNDSDKYSLTSKKGSDDKFSKIYNSKTNKTKVIANEGFISNQIGNNYQTLTNDDYELKVKNNKFIFGKNSWSITNEQEHVLSSGISGGQNKLSIYDNKKILMDTKNLTIKLSDGNFYLVGNKDPNSDKIQDYEAINQFYARAEKFSFVSQGGYFNVSGARVKYDLGSSKLASNIPLTGPDEVFHINAVEGDILTEVGLGDVIVKNYNFSINKKIELRCGSKIHPTASGLELTAFKTSYYLNTLYSAINSYLDFHTTGDTELYSFKNIEIEANTGTLDVFSMRDMKFDTLNNMHSTSLLNMSMTSEIGRMDLKSQTGMTLDTAAMMLLKAIAQINIEGSAVNIKGGGGGLEPTPLGNKLIEWLGKHTHPTGVGPSSPPIEAGELPTILSPLVKNN